MYEVSGEWMVAREQKAQGGKPVRTVEGGNTDLRAVSPPQSGAMRTVGVGRTINMGDFNFARIDVAFTFAVASLPQGVDATDCARVITGEILDREVAVITQEERKNCALPVADALAGRRLRVTYGVTRSPRPYESVRFDITVDEPLPDGADFEVELARVQAITGEFITKEFKRLSQPTTKQYGY
jgi:hypothetical protein